MTALYVTEMLLKVTNPTMSLSLGLPSSERPDWVNFGKTATITLVPEFTGVCKIDFSACTEREILA